MNEWIEFGKDENPVNTVKKIKQIVDELGIKLGEIYTMCDKGNCYSSRVKIDGELSSFFAANGKGLSEELSKASCLGEMIERLSNKMFPSLVSFYGANHLFYEDIYPLYDIRSEKQEEAIKNIIDKCVSTIKFPVLFKTNETFVIDLLCKSVKCEKNQFFYTVPFYSVDEKKVVYLPEGIIRCFVGSTGMAAGNTLEEALVQGISEIIERYVYYKLLIEDIVPPQIPNAIIENYPKINDIVLKIKKNKDFNIRIYDASLGIGLPVVCLVIIDKKTGSLGIKLGAHPNMGIALQRLFTEAMQGLTIDEFVKKCSYRFERKNNFINTALHFSCSRGSVCTNFIKTKPTYSFNEWKDVKGLSNKELLKFMLNILKSNNSKVYIRDVSYLGFPSVYIYASEFSDSLVDIAFLRHNYTIASGYKAFRNIDNITEEGLKEIKNAMIVKKSYVYSKPVMGFRGYFYDDDEFGYPYEADVLLMIIEYMLGNVENAIKVLNNIILASGDKIEKEKKEYYYVLLKYFESIYHNVDKEEAKEIIYNTFDKEIVDEVYDDFSEKEKILAKLYPICKMDCTKCSYKNCKNKAINELFNKLMDKEEKNPSDYTKLASVIE